MSTSTGSLNGTTNSPVKLVHRKSISLDHTNADRFEQKKYKLVDAVDRNGRLIPYVTIYVPIESKDRQGHTNNNYMPLDRTKYDTDPRRTVLTKAKIRKSFIYHLSILLSNFAIYMQ